MLKNITIEDFINIYSEEESKKYIFINIVDKRLGKVVKIVPEDALHYNFKDSVVYDEYKDYKVLSFSINDNDDKTYLIINI